jgi:hypothetical protein
MLRLICQGQLMDCWCWSAYLLDAVLLPLYVPHTSKHMHLKEFVKHLYLNRQLLDLSPAVLSVP